MERVRGEEVGEVLNMKSKYNMTLEQNIFVAKRNIVDYIYKSAQLEGLGVTYPDTEAIFNGVSAPGVKVTDIIAVNNLKHAWQFLLDTLESPLDYAYLCKLNQLVGGDNLVYNAGYIRTLSVSIGGTSWKPEIPVEDDIKARLIELQRVENATDRAIEIMLYVMRGQFFLDGNKRTAMLAANKEMIANGQGIISIPVELIPQFTPLLVKYYETGEPDTIKAFVYDNCIDGMNI
jgi:Fic family protein